MIDKTASQTLIDSIRQNLDDLKDTEMPPKLRDEQNLFVNSLRGHLNHLAERLGQAESPEQVEKVHKQLEELNKNLTSSRLLCHAVIATYNRSKDETIDPQAVQETAFNSVKIAWNLATSFAFDDSKSMKERMTGFAHACMQGAIGMCQGALKGFDEGKGFWDTVKKMAAGSFEQGMGGYSKSLATSLLSDKRKEKGQLIIDDLRETHDKVRKELAEDPENPIKQARKAIIDAEAKYLDELEKDLNKSEGEKLSKTVSSLEILQLSNAGTSLQSSGLSLLHRLVMGDDKKLDKGLVEQLGKDTVNITRNINQILDDSSKNLPSRLWNMTKAYVGAAGDGITAFVKGFEEKGSLKEKYVHAVESGFSTFMSKFSKALDDINPQKKSEAEPDLLQMGSLQSTQKTMPHGTTLPPSNELLSPSEKEPPKVGTVKEESDLSIKHS